VTAVSALVVMIMVVGPNFDNRSSRPQFEINALIVNDDFGKQPEAVLENDMADAVR